MSKGVTYCIRDWQKHFENHESRKVKSVSSVSFTNAHDGAGYRRVVSLPNGAEVFAAWILMVQIASRMPMRGVLQNYDGPLDASDMAAMTGLAESSFASAIEALMHPRVKWLEIYEPSEAEADESFCRREVTRLYLMRNMRNGLTKIGISNNVAYREKTLQSEEPEILLLAHWDATPDMQRQFHRHFRDKRVRGEWFNLGVEDINEIKNLVESNAR